MATAPRVLTPRRVLRFLGRLLVLAAGTLLALPVLPWRWPAVVLPGLSPYIAVVSVVAARSASIVALLAVPVLVLALVRRRWFCRYACPVGLLLEAVGLARPAARKRTPKAPPIGQWVVLIALGGAALGHPSLLWLDPLATFNGFFSLWHLPFGTVAALAGAGLPLLVLLGLAVPNLWCGRLCPLGGTQDLLRNAALLARRTRRPAAAAGPALARRAVLGAGVGAAAALAQGALRGGRGAVLRPPGAAAGRRFTELCTRCGNCVRACPAGIIEQNLTVGRGRGFLTPVVRFDTDYCHEDCRACTLACPSGALRPLSLGAKARAVVGLADVDMELCWISDDMDCAACQTACPYEAIEIAFDEDSYMSAVIVKENCVGCGACELACPANPTRAIVVRPPS